MSTGLEASPVCSSSGPAHVFAHCHRPPPPLRTLLSSIDAHICTLHCSICVHLRLPGSGHGRPALLSNPSTSGFTAAAGPLREDPPGVKRPRTPKNHGEGAAACPLRRGHRAVGCIPCSIVHCPPSWRRVPPPPSWLPGRVVQAADHSSVCWRRWEGSDGSMPRQRPGSQRCGAQARGDSRLPEAEPCVRVACPPPDVWWRGAPVLDRTLPREECGFLLCTHPPPLLRVGRSSFRRTSVSPRPSSPWVPTPPLPAAAKHFTFRQLAGAPASSSPSPSG